MGDGSSEPRARALWIRGPRGGMRSGRAELPRLDLEGVFAQYGKRLYRCKGMLFFDGVREPTAVQCVGAHVECERMAADAVEAQVAAERRSRLIFIGRTRGIEQVLEGGFAAL
mmetsp:Transcript_43797/g.141206  ORF Transcript_43797/g.141206 Transcript_43797/m.141206 type:complete len:113 (+) Transcript_43797:367-705(+)